MNIARFVNRTVILGALTASVFVLACGDDSGESDAGSGPDGSVTDASTVDAVAPTIDGAPVPDATPDYDGAPPFDAPPPAGIVEARAAADGVVDVDIYSVWVTYEKAAIGTDVAGFFIQDVAAGPALFVAIDPATLSPVPAVGDDVSFTITEMGTVDGRRHATMVTGVVVHSSANDVTALTQDVSGAADVVSAVTDYESELVTVSGSVTSAFAASGQDHVEATIDTTGVTGDGDYRLRLPTSVADDLALENGCTFTVSNTPLWRLDAIAHVSAWNPSEVDGANCSAPTVVGAVATDDTTVVVELSRAIDDTSITDVPNQITIDNMLVTSVASVNGRFVTVTTTAQTTGTTYTVTVANSVLDIFGVGVDTNANTATFSGYGLARCADLMTTMDVWGEPAAGFDLRPYTNSTLHWVGCTLGCTPASFYCTDDADSMEFGTTEIETLRALVDPGDATADVIPATFNDCCSGANPTDVCNAPNTAADADALCKALGWGSGTLIRDVVDNFCPEAGALQPDGSDWSSDFVEENGYGAEYQCNL
jgi:hypothetical protein